MSWQRDWPVAFARANGAWTVKNGAAFGVLDPDTGVATAVDPAEDRKLPGLAPALADGDLVGYRFGRRGIVAARNHFVKVVRPSRVDALIQRHRHFADPAVAFRVPAVVGADSDGRVVLSRVEGRSLHELIRVDPERGLDDIGRLLVALQRQPAVESLPVREPDQVAEWVAASRRAPTGHLGLIEQVAGTLRPLTPSASVVVHGDLHDKNVFASTGGGDDPLADLGLIDLDGVSLGAVEDDVVNLAVHLELRNLQGRAGLPAGARASALYEAFTRAGGVLDPDRVRLVERHTWFRLACLYQYRGASEPLVPELLRRAMDEDRYGHRDLGPAQFAGAEVE